MNSQKKNGTEKKSDNSKSTKNKTSQVKAGDQYVVDGAIFKCQFGSAPSQILAANNQKVLVQGKAMVVDKDTNFKIATSPFATCTQNKNPQSPICLYAKGQWNKQTTVEQGDQNALTESSTMMCPIFAGEISCVFPGQIKNVSVADLENTKVQTLSNFPLALVVTFPNFEKEKKDQKTTSVNSVAVSKNTVRIDEQITLHAYKQTKQKDEITYPNFNNWVFFTTKELEEDKENKIKKGTYINDLKIFKHVWSPFNIKLHKPGKYHIEACGDKTLEKYEKLDPNSPLKTENNKTTPPFYNDCEEVVDVVEQNRITRILKDGEKTNESIINVKQGTTTVFSPTFLLDFDSNFEDLNCTVEKGNGESVDEGDYSFDVDKKTLSLTPSAGEVNYKITFYLHKKTEEGVDVEPFNEKSISVRSYNEAVLFAYVPTSSSKDKPTNNVTLKRPQEGLAFTVKLKDKKDGDFSQVEWRMKKDDIYVDEPFKTKGETALYFFKEEGKYEIEADLTNTSYCNGGVTGTGVQKTSGDITQKIISHKFEISNNYVTDITLNSNNGRRYVGVKYRIDPKFLFGDGTFATERNSVEYKADGADKDCLRQGIFRVDKPGEYKIVATLNGKSFESQAFKIEEAEIKKWEFCDVDNKKIDKIGRNNKFGINASVPAWGATEENSKRAINVSLYCQKKELCAFKTELDKDGNFHVDNIDVEKDIFEKISNKNISHDGDKDLILTFVVFDSPSRIVKNLSRTERMGLFSRHTNLCVKSRPSVDGYFADSNGKRLVKMLTYNDKANARLQVLNYSDAKLKNLKFRLYENKRGLDPVVFENKEYIKPNESGIVEIPMPIGEDGVKEENHGDSKLPRLFYFKVFEKCKSHSTLMLDFHSTETLRRVCSYPKTFAEYDYDVRKETSAVQDEVLNELSAETAGKKYESEKLKEVRSYYHQMKIASPKDEAKEYVNSYNSLAPVVVGEEWEKEEEEDKEGGKCPRCKESAKDMFNRVKKAGVFDKNSFGNLKTICETYCKYMEALHMDTCWMKAHFFAQISVETGKGLNPRSEDLCYKTRLNLENTFEEQIFKGRKVDGKFKPDSDAAGNRIYKSKAIKTKLDDIYKNSARVEKVDEKEIAKLVYGKRADLGNETEEDGWTYRGGGYIQVTGKSNYIAVEKMMKAVGATGFDMINNGADEIKDNVELSTLASMAYLYIKGIYADGVANGVDQTLSVNKLVGKDIHDAYKRKQESFDKLKEQLETSHCTFGKKYLDSEEGKNIYLINLNNSTITFMKAEGSKEYVYKVMYNNKPVRVYLFTSEMIKTYIKAEDRYTSEFEAFEFPKSSEEAENKDAVRKDINYNMLPKWGRFGQGKKESDNWVNPRTCARLLGFFFSLSLNGYDFKIYYNDISVYEKDKDKYYDGHSTHKYGNSIDLRYPYSSGDKYPRLWNEIIENKYGNNEEQFISELKEILCIALKWEFTSNFAAKKLATLAKFAEGHKDHLHLGNGIDDDKSKNEDGKKRINKNK